MKSEDEKPPSRRDFLAQAGSGLGALALSSLLTSDVTAASPRALHPPILLHVQNGFYGSLCMEARAIWIFGIPNLT